MIKSFTLLSFVALTSSALIGSSFYKDSQEYLEVSNLVKENVGDSLITKLTQNNKTLNKIQNHIDDIDFEMSEYEESFSNNETWKQIIAGHDVVNNGRIINLNQAINRKNNKKFEFQKRYEKALIKAQNQEYKTWMEEYKGEKDRVMSELAKYHKKSN